MHEYLENFYGAMADGVNVGDESDRLYLVWRLAEAPVVAAAEGASLAVDLAPLRAAGAETVLTVGSDGGPMRTAGTSAAASAAASTARAVLAQVPADIETLRRSEPATAWAWRSALREVRVGAIAEGWQVAGIGRDGFYVLVRADGP